MKVAIVDVKSGQWDMFSPSPLKIRTLVALFASVFDQAQVAILKTRRITPLSTML